MYTRPAINYRCAGKNILIVDDTAMVSNIMVKVAQSMQCNTTLATGGAQAIELIAQNDYDLVVLDLVMPFVNGLHVLDFIEETKPALLDRVVITSGDSNHIAQVNQTQNYKLDGLIKPFSVADFVEMLTSHLSVSKSAA